MNEKARTNTISKYQIPLPSVTPLSPLFSKTSEILLWVRVRKCGAAELGWGKLGFFVIRMHVLYIYTTPLCTQLSEILHCWKARFSVDGACNCTMCDVHGQWACTLVYGKDVAHFIFGLGQLQNRKTLQYITKYWGSWLTPQCIYNLSKLWYFVWCFWCILASTFCKLGGGLLAHRESDSHWLLNRTATVIHVSNWPTPSPACAHNWVGANIWFCNLCNICCQGCWCMCTFICCKLSSPVSLLQMSQCNMP